MFQYGSLGINMNTATAVPLQDPRSLRITHKALCLVLDGFEAQVGIGAEIL
jgi:hypothetical protein